MSSADEHGPLAGRLILVVEDEFLIAVNIANTFREAGAEVRTAATLAAACAEAETQPFSASILDVRLGKETSEAVARILASRNIPFLFHTGQPLPDDMRRTFPDVRVLIKPVLQHEFVDALLRITAR